LSAHSVPETGDVIVREATYDGRSTYVLTTTGFADQILTGSYEQAVAHALAYARAHRARAWVVVEGSEPVLLTGQVV